MAAVNGPSEGLRERIERVVDQSLGVGLIDARAMAAQRNNIVSGVLAALQPLTEPQRLGQEGDIEAFAVSEDAQRHLAIRSPLNRAIFRALRDYCLSNMVDEDGYPYPLVDALSTPAPADIGTGEMEMVAIADDIEEAVRSLSTPALAEPVAERAAIVENE